MTELEKMVSGKIYDPSDKELFKLRTKSHNLSRKFTRFPENSKRGIRVLKELLNVKNIDFILIAPINFDYGRFTKIGKNTFANFNFTCLDCAPVTIREHVYIGPNVSLVPPVHPMHHEDRFWYKNKDGNWSDKEYALPITINDNCWLASNVIVCGGVTIGEGTVIGAGSVVTHDIPDHVFAAGNPCKVIRKITKKDLLSNHPELFAK